MERTSPSSSMHSLEQMILCTGTGWEFGSSKSLPAVEMVVESDSN